MKLSIIIPCYNAENYLPDLLQCLEGQIMKMAYNSPETDKEVEVFLIDDGSKVPVSADYPWVQIYRKENEGPGIARNVGLDHMTGDYFTFIDADDMVADYYLSAIFDKIEAEDFDYCYLSWTTMPGGWNCTVKLTSVEDKFPGFNLCVWNRVYKTATFGRQRFNPKKLWSEDADFIYRLNERGKKSFISEIMYYYRSDTPDSWTKRMFRGELDYNRIVYNLKEVRPDDTELLEEIRREYADNEIVLLTDSNGIPELEKYCMIMKYNTSCSGMELRGDPFSGFRKIQRPYVTQVLVYVSAEHEIGGIETFTYNFCAHMSKYYDITVLYDAKFAREQMNRLTEIVPVIKNTDRTIICDTAINTRIVKDLPKNIKYKQSIQMSHTCKMKLWGQLSVPQDKDFKVFVSDVAARSFGEKEGEYEVIHNLTLPTETKKALLLVSATRSTPEKGMKRMLMLARHLTRSQIPFIWLYFTKDHINEAPKNLIHMDPTLDISPYIKMADYLVQLSDSEAFGYSMVEALELGTAIITPPFEVLPELGIEEGKHGYVLPWDIDSFDCSKLLKIPKFKYKRDNEKIVKQWRDLLGYTKPTHKYKPSENVTVKIIKTYKDIALDRVVTKDTVMKMPRDRAQIVQQAGYGQIEG
ncbi:MAG: glycosyltransferase [Lachnospiraceae bacterium]|nr:glycosyltransferase [Lachnospiraceae bacterium]